MEIFIFDNATNTLRIDEHSILLIKEFADLWDIERNKCKEDKSGKDRLLAFKEFTYIYLTLDYKSPYFAYLEQDKHYAALVDSGLESEHIKNPQFVAAYNKYKEIQNSDPILSLIKTEPSKRIFAWQCTILRLIPHFFAQRETIPPFELR